MAAASPAGRPRRRAGHVSRSGHPGLRLPDRRSTSCCASTRSWSTRTSRRRCRATATGQPRPTSSSSGSFNLGFAGLRRRRRRRSSCSTGGPSGWRPTASPTPSAATSWTSAGWTSRRACPEHLRAARSRLQRRLLEPAGRDVRRRATTATRSTAVRCASSTSPATTRRARTALEASGPHPARRAARPPSSSATATRERSSARGTSTGSTAYAFGALAGRHAARSAARAVFRDAVTSGALPDERHLHRGRRPRVPRLPERACGTWRALRGHALSRGCSRAAPRLRDSFPDLDGPDGAGSSPGRRCSAARPGRWRRRCSPTDRDAASSRREHRGLLQGGAGRRRARPPARGGARARRGSRWRCPRSIPTPPRRTSRLRPRDEQPGQDRSRTSTCVCVNADLIADRGRAARSRVLRGALHDRLLGLGGQRLSRPLLDAFSYVDEVWVGSAARARRGGGRPPPFRWSRFRSRCRCPSVRRSRGRPAVFRRAFASCSRSTTSACSTARTRSRRRGVHARIRARIGRVADRQDAQPRPRSQTRTTDSRRRPRPTRTCI